MNQRIQHIFAWAGPVLLLVFLIGFTIMGFLPPLSPNMSAEQVAAHYEEHRTGIRLGATLLMQFALLGFLWTAVVSIQIRRIEKNSAPILTYAQMLLGVAAFFVFILMSLAWTVAAFRPERDIDLIMLFNDLGWFSIVMPVFPLALQATTIGLAILSDTRTKPLFPRWAAYLNFWCALLFLPGALATFFKSGPFAWSGLFDFWIPVGVFGIWIIVMAWLVSKAINMPDEETPELS